MSKWVSSPAYEAAVTIVARARKASGLTQREVEGRLGKGYHGYLAKIERKQRQMNIIEFIAIARALGVDEQAMFAEILDAIPSDLDV